jgi:N-acetylglucosamine-6-phosphate deacetylase
VSVVSVTGRDPSSRRSLEIRIADGRIAAISPGPERETAFVAAGLVDLQVNGFAGQDLNAAELTPETVAALAAALRRVGVTTFVPTIISAPEAQIIKHLAAVAAARMMCPMLAHCIPFVHLEGPHLSAQDGARGAHPLAAIRPPDPAEFDRWQKASGGLVGLVTLSPHFAEAPAYIRELRDAGVHAAIGHTDATPDQITAAVDAGALLSTHLGNGAAATLPRHPNVIWTQLADDRLTATFIADGHHLPPDTLKAMVRAKGVSRSILVSDAAALGGMAPGRYRQPVGGDVELSADGRLALAGTPYLAGAALPLKDGVAIAASSGAVTLGEAMRLATVNPGRFVGGRGTLAVGASADLIRFRWTAGDRTLDIETVLVQGRESP